MCRVNQTQMSCGHILTNYTEHCSTGQPGKPCPNLVLEQPRAYLPDSCARCDPEYRTTQARQAQRERHAELTAQLLREGKPDEINKVLHRIDKLNIAANKAICEARTLCSSSVDVEFPGIGIGGSDGVGIGDRDRAQGTFHWVEGKCYWKSDGPSTPAGSEAKQVKPLVSGPPRLRHTKKGYVDPIEEVGEQPRITTPPRLRTNKKYSGPRDSVFVEVESLAPEPQHRLRRMKKSDMLGGNGITNQEPDNEEQDNDSDSDGTIRPVPGSKQAKHTTLVIDEVDEDMWLELADKCATGKAPVRRVKDRTTE